MTSLPRDLSCTYLLTHTPQHCTVRKGTEDGSAFYAVTFFFDRHPFDFLDILREHRKARTPAFIAKLDASQAAAAAAEDEDPVEAAAGACHVPHTVSR